MGLRRAPALALAALAALSLAGCGSGGGDPELVVFAAASLSPPFEEYADAFGPARVRLSFAGSDELAAQIRQGLVPDVYAAANTELPKALAAEGLIERPVVFATNELVVAVPAGSRINSLSDLERPGVAVGIGDRDVPVGAYARQVLARLGEPAASHILDNVRTSEPDVSGIVGKLTQGAVDAGFVYASDVAAAGGRLVAIELPSRLRPAVAYGAGVATDAAHPALAEKFLSGLLDGDGAGALARYGFGPPPRGPGATSGGKGG